MGAPVSFFIAQSWGFLPRTHCFYRHLRKARDILGWQETPQEGIIRSFGGGGDRAYRRVCSFALAYNLSADVTRL